MTPSFNAANAGDRHTTPIKTLWDAKVLPLEFASLDLSIGLTPTEYSDEEVLQMLILNKLDEISSKLDKLIEKKGSSE